MRIVVVGTDLAPVVPGAGALETLLSGWAAGLSAAHDVTVVSVGGGAVGAGPVPAGAPARPAPYRTVTIDSADGLRAAIETTAADVVILNNRPAWQVHVDAPSLHLFHNWPDAWGGPNDANPATLVGGAGAAAVSRALADVVADRLRRPPGRIGVVAPFVDGDRLDVAPRPERGLVVSPNRLMVKKGVRELVAVAGHPSMRGRRILITDYLSPWRTPTAEHLALRALVGASPAELVAPPAGRPAMAALYARAEVVVCPSIRPEGLGLTAVEAQAVGVPVVSSGLGGLAEACLRPDLLADPADPADFAAAIARAARLDGAARAALRSQARSRWSSAASLESVLDALDRARPAANG